MNVMYLTEECIKNKKYKKNIKKRIKDIDLIALDMNLKKNKKIVEYIESLKIPTITGRWLFRYLVIQTLEYILNIQNVKLQNQNITLMFKKYDEIIAFYIEYLARNSKNLKIVTDKRRKIKNLEDAIYEKYGIALFVSNNRRKAIKNEEIIVNFDFNENEINEFLINDYAILINLKEKININTKRFNGLNINFYEIEFRNKFLDLIEWKDRFKKNEFYESYLYDKDNIYNIEKTIIKDNVLISDLIGNNGVVHKKEIKNLKKICQSFLKMS